MAATWEVFVRTEMDSNDIADRLTDNIVARMKREFTRVTAVVLTDGLREEGEWLLAPDKAAALGVVDGDRIYMCAAPQSAADPALHLYLVEILGVGVKVGISSQPEKRIATHTTAAATFGRSIGRVWLSRPHPDARTLETLIRGGHPNEYLPITFEAALQRALDLALAAR
jgi:hypothetical protein